MQIFSVTVQFEVLNKSFFFTGNLYFTNSKNYVTYMEVSRMNGTHRMILFQEKEATPRALAVNPIKRSGHHLYLTA